MQRHATPRTMVRMSAESSSFLYRHAWWLPASATALAVPLVAATLRPSEQSVLLAIAILCALPWTLALLLLDLSAGFADRAEAIVCLGLFANVALLWWSTALLRARVMHRTSQQSKALEF